MKILIYGGEGVSPLSLSETLKITQGISGHIEVVDHQFLIENNWEDEAKLVIFPGGRDRPYHQNLKKKGTTKIRNFVEKGGSYLGICAGAYFGAREIVFEKGTPLEVHEKRELGFFPGAAVGTLYSSVNFTYESEEGAHPAKVSFEGRSLYLYYNGGCTFKKVQKYPNTKVLAYFLDAKDQPAIVHCTFGKGKAILSGVHFEVSSTSLKEKRYHTVMVEKIKRSDANRRSLAYAILSGLYTQITSKIGFGQRKSCRNSNF